MPRPAERVITHEGTTRTLKEWAEALAISPNALAVRLSRGWPVERALVGPIGRHVPRPAERVITHEGTTRTLKEWAEALGIRPTALTLRLSRGWPVERRLGRADWSVRAQPYP
jgi:hypothetical protein